MAVTYTNKKVPQFVGTQRMVVADVTMDSSYATNGESVTAASFGLSRLDRLVCYPASGYIPQWNGSTSAPKIKVYYGDNNNASDGPLIEVPNTTDLSAITFSVEAYGN